jgi:nitrite reductase/ring-hydroxylating ferredoxin subunit
MREARLAGTPVLLARRPSGEVVAFGTHCPHQGTPLKHAGFFGRYLQCPQHRYVYDPDTGENILPTRQANVDFLWRMKPGHLRTHRVEEREGWIWVAVAANPVPPEYGPDNPPPPLPAELRGAPRPQVEDEGPAEHATESISARAGTEFELTVPTRALPGHLWRVESGDDLVVLVGQAFEPGDAPRYQLRFAARSPGQVELRCVYGRPWGGRPSEVRTYSVTIEPDG